MTGLTIDELAIPATLDGPGGADFVEMTRVRNEIEADAAGNYDLAVRPAELLPLWRAQKYEPKRLFLGRVGGRIVARAIIETNREPASRTAWVTVEVLRDFRRRGIGAALYERLEAIAGELGTAVLQSYVMQGAYDSVERIVAPTGYGSVPRESPATRFLLARDFRLEQVARVSRLELPIDRERIERALGVAVASTGDDYRLVEWVGRTPEDRLDQLALLRGRMATDAPNAGLEPDNSPWTADRVLSEDEALESSPRTRLTVLAEHAPTGEAAGYTELEVPPEPARAISQGDTLVVQEHRGRRLGMALKLANLLRVDERWPGHPSVITFNAEENRHMLQVNEAIGFVPWGYEGAWRKEL
jgi:GNAT superfamily N-acetyltransferase